MEHGLENTREADDDGNAGYGTPPERRRIIWEAEYDDGKKETIFDNELALAALLMSGAISVHNHWWRKDWPAEARLATSLNVNCSDVFAWGCSDAEEMSYPDIRAVYDHWQKDPSWGTAVWCMIKRKEMPQRPVQKQIEDGGKWDIEALRQTHGLRSNYYDGISYVLARMKYSAYSAWATKENKVVLPYSPGWWDGWREYIAANPEWSSPLWSMDEAAAISAWKAENGWNEENVQ